MSIKYGDRVVITSGYPRDRWPDEFVMTGATATARSTTADDQDMRLLEVDGLSTGHGAGRRFWWVANEFVARAAAPTTSTTPMSKKLKAVLDHLTSGRTLTQGEAIVLGYGTRLADLVHRLKKRGHDIRCTRKTDIHGSPYGEYRLVTRDRFGKVKKAA